MYWKKIIQLKGNFPLFILWFSYMRVYGYVSIFKNLFLNRMFDLLK